MDHRTPAERSALESAPEPLGMDDQSLRRLEGEVLLATYLRALGTLSGMMAHEAVHPLHTMSIYLELVRVALDQPSSAERAKAQGYMEVIRSEIHDGEARVRQVCGQMRVAVPRPRIDLAATLGDLMTYLKPYAMHHHLELEWENAPEPMFVESEEDDVRHAVLHLLLTAVEATPERGALRIGAERRRGSAVVRVEGVPAVTEAMRALDRPPDPQALLGPERGLEAARRVVDRHHGRIEVRPGASRATVEIELPLLAAEER